ncbi:hypothetical protein MTR67_020353 [Solanum verrucosum]|uniref:Glabrous enhancer-binding protein-like DBD domain-containing protein n=2 Tax=Solanum TaxID=4107 RepID=A0AAF0QPJ2_SOLVR|nr:GLABROUS1 enhancer-binding protein-like [Solanum verrucosum]WMV26968.1 hypothetical protein MTR67_020353 [Solanum verrucosum]
MAKNRPEKEEEEESGEEMEVSSPGNADTESGSGSGSESESESEPEQEQPPKKPPVAAPKKPQPQDDSSSSTEEESDSESEPDPETQKPNPVVKPIASKPMDEPKKAAPIVEKKPKSKADATAKLTSPKKSTAVVGAKRPVDDGEAKESKRSKKKPEKQIETPVSKTPTDDVKRQLFQRLWSEDDEIAILKGMTDYRSKKKADPVADLSAFHEFIKKSLHVDVSKAQLQDKIRRLKKKYENNAGKEKKGKERTFSKPHEQKAYELSQKVWGKEKTDKVPVEVVKVENVTASKGRSNSGDEDNGVLDVVKEEKLSAEVEKTVEVTPNLNLTSCGGSVAALEKWLEEYSGLLSIEKLDEIKKKSTSLQVAEAGLCLRRVNLIAEQGELMRKAMNASGIDI